MSQQRHRAENTGQYSTRDRVEIALSRFLFPGHVVPRGQMADAVLVALERGDDFTDYLPAKGSVPLIPGVEKQLADALGDVQALTMERDVLKDDVARLTARAERLQTKLALVAEAVGLGNESAERDRDREKDGYLIPTIKAVVAERDRLREEVRSNG